MELGWIIAGPGSTYVNADFELLRGPHRAAIFKDPGRAIEALTLRYPGVKFYLHQLITTYVAFSRNGAWESDPE